MRSHLACGMLALLLIVQGTAFFSFTQTLPTVSDTIGYVYAAQRLASGHGPTFEDAHNPSAGPYFSMFAFQIRRADDSRMFLGFPPGCSLLMAAGILLTGRAAAVYYVVPLLAVLGLAATFYVGALVSGKEWTGFWAAALLAFTPAYCEFGTSSWSEVPSLTFITAGVCLYLLSRTEGKSNRASIIFSVLSGIVIVYSFFIRYANVAIVPALVIYELFVARKRILTEWRRWIFFGFLGLGFVAILMFNQFYYGGLMLTSYSPAHGWYPYPAFSLSYALGPSFVGGYSLIEACKTLWQNFSWMVLLVPIGWLLLKRSSALLVSLAVLSTLALYSVYAFAPKEINSRFLLPAFPFLVIAIATVITTAGAYLRNAKWRWGVGVIMAAVLCWPVPGRLRQLNTHYRIWDTQMVDKVNVMTASTPENAVFLSYVYNDFLVFYGRRSVLNYRRIPPADVEAGRYRMELLEPCLVQTVDRLLEGRIPVYYIEDRSPPFWDSLSLLQRHYVMEIELAQSDSTIYRLIELIESDNRGELICPL